MRAPFILPLLILAACATTPVSDPEPDIATSDTLPSDRLGPQTLAAGACGLFGWDRSADPRFIFFAEADRALYVSGEGPVRTLTPDGDFPATTYGPVTLTLGSGEAMIDGVRYPSARITETLDDGFTRLRPVVILQMCQGSDEASN